MVEPTEVTLAKPIFVLALPKSYTSVFSGILGQHPSIAGLPELNLFVGPKVRDWALQPKSHVFTNGLLRAIAQLEFGEQTFQTVQESYNWLEGQADAPVAQVFDWIREKCGDQRVLDQSPVYSVKPAYVQQVLDTFPDARFIHLLRGPVSWVKSMEKWVVAEQIFEMYNEGAAQPMSPIEIWAEVEYGLRDMLPKERTLTVHGERSVTEPEAVMTEVLEWLDLDREPNVVAEMMFPERSEYACWGPMNAPGGNNPDFLKDARLRRRDDLDKLMTVDTSAFHVPDDILQLAREFGYS